MLLLLKPDGELSNFDNLLGFSILELLFRHRGFLFHRIKAIYEELMVIDITE